MVLVTVGPAKADRIEPPKIEVTGEAEVLLEPDYIEWVIDIRTKDKVPKLARETNETMFETLLEVADKADIDARDIESGEPQYTQLFRDGSGPPTINAYVGTEVHRRVTLVLRDMDEFDEMLDAVHPMGVLYTVRRKSSQYEETVRAAEREALKRARQTAVAQAAALGQNIGKAIRVEVKHASWTPTAIALFGDTEPRLFDDESEAAGPSGKIRVQVFAEVSFRLE
jgi:uncharacterized protein YggE